MFGSRLLDLHVNERLKGSSTAQNADENWLEFAKATDSQYPFKRAETEQEAKTDMEERQRSLGRDERVLAEIGQGYDLIGSGLVKTHDKHVMNCTTKKSVIKSKRH